MTNISIPQNWKQTTLGKVLQLKYGKSLPNKDRDGIGYPVYGSNGIVGKHSLPLISKPGIIIGRKGSFGEVNISDGPFFPIDTTYYIDEFNGLPIKYWYYQLKKLPLTKLNRSTAIPGLNREDAYQQKILFPPKNEQQQIATKLDELLTQVNNIKQRLDVIPSLLKMYIHSVLLNAVRGGLTEKYRGTSAINLNSPVTIGLEYDDAPIGWEWKKLIDLAKLESGHTPRKSIPEYWTNGDIHWISLQDIRQAHGTIINNTKHKPTMLGIENSSARLLPRGTVCFSRDISVGYTTIMGTEMSTTQHFANWICGNSLNNRYLMYALMAAKDHLTISGQGTTVKTIYMPALKEFHILLPPLDEQILIVRQVEKLLSIADKIEEEIFSSKKNIELLSQSILNAAFTGKLTEKWREATLTISEA
ncbi:TPA: restriction endonuclease subunit S [Legionella pneumophila]|jgi:type I restriction enzyme, S subunit|nr:restriction endonuclease subunit S [Legionella pneumophila]